MSRKKKRYQDGCELLLATSMTRLEMDFRTVPTIKLDVLVESLFDPNA